MKMLSFKKYLQSMLQSIINKLESKKNHNNDKHREEDHPVIEPNVNFFFFANYS